MKIFRTALAVFLLGASAAVPIPASAREVNSNPASADAFSVHGGAAACYSAGYVAGCEVAVDNTGNFLPTVANAQDLGTSALPFRTVYSVSATNTGAETSGTAGTTTAAGTSGTASTLSTVVGLQVFGKSVVSGVIISTVVPANSSYITVLSTGGTVTLTSVPNISTTTAVGGTTEIPSGTFLVVSSTATGSSVVFQDAGTLTGSQLQLGAASRTVSQYKTLTLVYDATDHFWREIAYGNN